MPIGLPFTKHILILLYNVYGISSTILKFGAGCLIQGRMGEIRLAWGISRHCRVKLRHVLGMGDLLASWGKYEAVLKFKNSSNQTYALRTYYVSEVLF